MERHGRFGVADQISNIKGIARIVFPPECIFTNAVQRMLPVINGELRQQRAVIKGVPADDWRGAGDLGSREIGTVLRILSFVKISTIFYIVNE